MNTKSGAEVLFALIVLFLAQVYSVASTEMEVNLPIGITIPNLSAPSVSLNSTQTISGASLNIPVSIVVSDEYAAIAARRLTNHTNSSNLISELPASSAEVLLYLPRAEQQEILGMTPEDAQARLSRYRLVNVTKSRQYTERQIPMQQIEQAVAKKAETDLVANHMSLFERLNSLFTMLRISFGPAEKAQAIKSQKESLDSSLDFHMTILEKLKYSTQINDDLTELEAQSIISSADSKISELNKMKLLVSQAQSQAELDDAKAQIQPLFKDIIPEVKSQSVRLMQTRLSEVVKRDEETQRKLECSLNAMKAKNISTDKIDEKLGELSAKVLFAKDDLRKAEENSHQGNYTIAELKTISAQSKLSDCYITLKDIVKDIKASKGTIIDCVSLSPDTVVVAEET